MESNHNRLVLDPPVTKAPAKPKRAPAKPKAAPKPTAVTTTVVTTEDNMVRWANTGVVLMAVLSAWLNGYANSLSATIPRAGWLLGIVIPIIVLISAKVAGKQLRRGHVKRAQATAAAGLGLLLLSVWHCAVSISLLTFGVMPTFSWEGARILLLTLPMAVAIDGAMVACEVATLDI